MTEDFNIETQKHRNIETQKHRNIETQKHRNRFSVSQFLGARQVRAGFTITEVLIAIAIVSVLSALSVAYFNSFLARNELKNEALKIVDMVRRARGQSMAGQEDSAWGVHFESGKYVLFKGSTYSAGDAFNEEITLPAVLTISAINLNGSGSEAVFSKIRGETSNYGTTTISNDIGETKNVVINSVGNIELR